MLAVSDALKTPITSLCLHAKFVEDADTRVRILAALDEMQRMTDDSLAFIREDMRSEKTRTVDLHVLLESFYDVAMSLPGLLDEIERCPSEPLGALAASAAHRVLLYGFLALYRESDSEPLVGSGGPG